VRQLTTTPNAFGVVVRSHPAARTAEVLVTGRKLRCAVAETVPAASLWPGREVILNATWWWSPPAGTTTSGTSCP
jgi:hypothetical protein